MSDAINEGLHESAPVDAPMFHVKPSEATTESSSMYARLKTQATGKPFMSKRKGGQRRNRDMDAPGEAPFTPGRDPRGLGSVLDSLTQDLGWSTTLAKSQLLVSWPSIVGADIAARTNPVAIEDATLTVACESTAWATQLRLMSTDILTKILQSFPEADVTAIRFQGPNAPSWKRGPRSIPGRGPRDTYG
jgi:predicted nucleic acid-binding Zn ribbon protein